MTVKEVLNETKWLTTRKRCTIRIISEYGNLVFIGEYNNTQNNRYVDLDALVQEFTVYEDMILSKDSIYSLDIKLRASK